MAADGGIAKTTLWWQPDCRYQQRERCIRPFPDMYVIAQKVAFLTTEDSVRKNEKKPSLAGANMSNIITPDFWPIKKAFCVAGSLELPKWSVY